MAPRTFLIESYVDENGRIVVDRDAVDDLVSDLIGSIVRLGGMFSVAVHREEVEHDKFESTAVLITHDKFSPATKLSPDPEPAKDEAASAVV